MIVLLYHRVCDLATDPQLLCVSPSRFDDHIDVIRRRARIVPLSEALVESNRCTKGDNRVAITFDDGYADNLESALPILTRHDAPATVFVTTRPDRTVREFWWDALEARLLGPGELPRRLELNVGDSRRTWDLGDAAFYTQEGFVRHCGWNVTQPPPTPRHACYVEMCEWLRPMPADRQQAALALLDDLHGEALPARDTHRCMSDKEIRALTASGLVEVGAHTMTHPVLSTLPREAQARELAESRRQLEWVIGRRVEFVSYPYGTRKDYSTTTIQEARQAGYRLACANFPGAIDDTTDRFQLPRYLIRDWNADELDRRLTEWLAHE